jgi:hypothetical protein
MGDVSGVHVLLDAIGQLPPVQAAEARAALLALVPDHAAELGRLRQECRDAARVAYQRGYRAGYERGARVAEAEWPSVVAPLAGLSHAELERRRWTVRGEQRTRETFGSPHPGDYTPTTIIRLEAAS